MTHMALETLYHDFALQSHDEQYIFWEFLLFLSTKAF